MAACLHVRKRDHRRRKALLRQAQRHLRHNPAFAYYLSLGTVPKSLTIFEED